MTELVDTKAAAEWLSVSRRTIERLGKSGALPPVYIMGAVRFRKTDVEALIERGTRTT